MTGGNVTWVKCNNILPHGFREHTHTFLRQSEIYADPDFVFISTEIFAPLEHYWLQRLQSDVRIRECSHRYVTAGLFHNEKNFTISFIRYKEQSPEFYRTYWHSLIKKCSAPIKILSIFCSLCHTAFVNNIFCCIAFEICNGIWFFLWLKHLWKILCEVWRKNVVSREK